MEQLELFSENELMPKWEQYGYVSEEAFNKQINCYKWRFACGYSVKERIHKVDMDRHSYFLHIENFFDLNKRKRRGK